MHEYLLDLFKTYAMIKNQLLAYPGTPETLLESGKNTLNILFPGTEFDFFNPEPDILVFLSGGSENEAVQIIRPDKFYLLAALEENNLWASATEVIAWLDQRNIFSLLFDLHEPADHNTIRLIIEILGRLQTLNGQPLGKLGRYLNGLCHPQLRLIY